MGLKIEFTDPKVAQEMKEKGISPEEYDKRERGKAFHKKFKTLTKGGRGNWALKEARMAEKEQKASGLKRIRQVIANLFNRKNNKDDKE